MKSKESMNFPTPGCPASQVQMPFLYTLWIKIKMNKKMDWPGMLMLTYNPSRQKQWAENYHTFKTRSVYVHSKFQGRWGYVVSLYLKKKKWHFIYNLWVHN